MSRIGVSASLALCLLANGCIDSRASLARRAAENTRMPTFVAPPIEPPPSALAESHEATNDSTSPATTSLSHAPPDHALAQFVEPESAVDPDWPRIEEVSIVTADANALDEPSLAPTPEPFDGPEVAEIDDSTIDAPNAVMLDLSTALALVGGQHPVVGFARWRVQEAYARLDQADSLWLPTLRAGVTFHRHDGNLQAVDGTILDVNRTSLQAGFGAGANAAGSTPQPGLSAQFHLSDAIFQPRIAERTLWARQHAATTAFNDQLLQVATAYLNLLTAEQEKTIIAEARDRTADLSKLTADFAATGQGRLADADRVATELILIESRLVEADERAEIAATRLAEAVSLNQNQRIVVADPAMVPFEIVSPGSRREVLISRGLSNRPELQEARALVAVAVEQYERQHYAPFLPSLLLGVSDTGFGGGIGTTAGDFGNRWDVDALAVWEVRNLGVGESAARDESNARIEQSKFAQVRMMDQVARQVSEAHVQVLHRQERMEVCRGAIEVARSSYDRNLQRIRDTQGLPIEVLQSIRALEDAQRAYLDAVADYNESQFRLQWSLGWPISEPRTAP